MATLVLTDAQIFHDEFDLTGVLNNVSVEASSTELDVTTFGSSGWRERKGGLIDVRFGVQGFYDATITDDAFFENLGAGGVMSVAYDDAANSAAYFAQILTADYQVSGEIGDMLEISGEQGTKGVTVQGELLLPKTAITSSDSTTGRQLGAVASDESVYAALHVFAFDGTSLDVLVQSDDNSGMSTPTTRITFTQATGVTHEWGTPAAGAITDDYWRVNYTFTGTSVTAAVAVGIQ